MIGLIGAMAEEIDFISKQIQDKQIIEVGGQTIITGKINGVEVALVEAGIGKVQAAMAATKLCTLFKLDKLINFGVCGSLPHGGKRGDIIIGEALLQYDFDISPFGHPVAYQPGIKSVFLYTDEDTLNWAIEKSKTVGIDVKKGTIATGDTFIADINQALLISSVFNASYFEMEGAAVATVAHFYQVDFLIIRSISDYVGNPVDSDYNINLDQSISKLSTFLLSLIS